MTYCLARSKAIFLIITIKRTDLVFFIERQNFTMLAKQGHPFERLYDISITTIQKIVAKDWRLLFRCCARRASEYELIDARRPADNRRTADYIRVKPAACAIEGKDDTFGPRQRTISSYGYRGRSKNSFHNWGSLPNNYRRNQDGLRVQGSCALSSDLHLMWIAGPVVRWLKGRVALAGMQAGGSPSV